MSLRLQWLCLYLVIGALAHAGLVNPRRPASADESRPTVIPLEQGVTGQIKDGDGSAVARASVLAASVDPNGPAIPELAIVSDASGRYEWPLPPGRYELTVVADGYERVSKRVAVRAGQVARLDFLVNRSR
jgi:Carboxypeptidase regulatory-like domain